MIKIWDVWVRLFHWSLVVAVGFLFISGETGAGFFDWHRLAGEIVLVLVLFRIFWGIVGSSNARIASLVVSPLRAITHLRELLARKPEQERGHNAAGGWAVLVMLLLLTVQAITGMFIADEEEWVEGAFHGVLSSDKTDFLYNIHHMNAGLLQLFVLIHVVMIIVYYLFARQNLIKPMITGTMQWLSNHEPPEVRFGGVVTGLVCFISVLIAVALAAGWM